LRSVSLCACLSVRERICGTAGSIFPNFLCRSPVAVAPSSPGGVAIPYVLPVLWMTSRLAVVGRIIWQRMRCDAGAESDVHECLVFICCYMLCEIKIITTVLSGNVERFFTELIYHNSLHLWPVREASVSVYKICLLDCV